MEPDFLNLTDASVEAAIELEELKQGVRSDTPVLTSLFRQLRTPSPAFEGENGISMLADVRSYALFRDSLRQVQPKLTIAHYRDLQGVVEKFLDELEQGVAANDRDKIEQAKQFCLAINTNLITKQMADIHSRRERSDSRYVSHESTP